MPEEISVVENVDNGKFGIGKFVIGTFVLVGLTAIAFAFGPKHLLKKETEYTAVEDKPEETTDDKNQTVESN